MIPLFEVSGNKLVSLNGKKSSFYQIIPPDTEGMTEFSKNQLFSNIESELIQNDNELKIYWLDQKLYINSFSDKNINLGTALPCMEPLTTFFGNYPTQVNFYDNYLTCGNEYLRLFSLKEFPSKIEMLDTLYWPNFVLNIKKIEQNKAKKTVNLKRKLHFSGLFEGIKNIDSENAYHEAQNVLEDLTTGETSLFQIECFIIARGDTKKELDKNSEKIVSNFNAIDALVFQEERGLSYFFQTLIPGVEPSFKRSRPCFSEYVGLMIPFHQDFIHDEGIELLSKDEHSIYWNLFDPNAINYNILITGQSGQGKSMMAHKILKHELSVGTKALILDLGNSFYKTARFYNGSIFSQKFNPLQFKNPRYLKEFVLSVVDDNFSKKDKGHLFQVIQDIIEDDIQSFNEFLERLESEFNGISFYFSEIRDYFSNDAVEITDLTYCDFSHYPETMKAPLIIYLIEYFKNIDGEKIFIFDECWHLLNKNAEYIAECFRTFRKHKASAIAISQNLDDFSMTPLGRVIIQNTYWKLLFRQNLAPSEFIDTHSIDLLENIYSKKDEYSEFLLLSDDIKKPVRFYPSIFEYELFNTRKDQLIRFDNYFQNHKDYMSFQECMRSFVQIKHPNEEVYYEE